MELQAEVARGGEGAKFTLERLAPVLVLMDLRRGRFWLRRWEKLVVSRGGDAQYKQEGITALSVGPSCGGVPCWCRVNTGVG